MTRMREAGLDSFGTSLIRVFNGKSPKKNRVVKNIIGWVKGTQYPENFIVISAHYDHVGVIDGEIYHGASDNASGTACILAMAKYFKQHPHACSLIFAAFDNEEKGSIGSHSFVDSLPPELHLRDIKLNLNLDMIARNDKNELFVCGIFQNPSYGEAIKEIQNKTSVHLLMGHDTGMDRENWVSLSDHIAFHKKNIPFLYFGVEDHVDYHKPADTWDKINLPEYIENCNMITLFTTMLYLPGRQEY
jgi:Zn-dependent M28 family amino/carboxypeptidase